MQGFRLFGVILFFVALCATAEQPTLVISSRPCKTQRHILWQGLRPFFHAVNPREFKILVIET